MRKPPYYLAVDIDGVIADSYLPAITLVNATIGGLEGELRKPNNYDFSDLFPTTPRHELEQALHNAWQSQAPYVFAPAVKGAAEVLHILDGKGLLAGYVTARSHTARHATLHWLDGHGFPIAPVLMGGKHKAEQCANVLRATHLIDDSPESFQNCEEFGVTAILYEQPYNQLADLQCQVVSNWQEILELFVPDMGFLFGEKL